LNYSISKYLINKEMIFPKSLKNATLVLLFFLLTFCSLNLRILAQTEPNIWDNKGWDRHTLGTADNETYLSQDEKDVIYHLNMARTNPAKYAKEFLEPMLRFYKDKNYKEPGWDYYTVTEEGISPLREAIKVLKNLKPVNPLEPSFGICLAALDHARDQSKTGEIGHSGKDRSTVDSRIERYGVWKGNVSESISYGFKSGREIVSQLLIDDGVPERGHRFMLLSSDFRLAGVSVMTHKKYGSICVIDFATEFFQKKTGKN